MPSFGFRSKLKLIAALITPSFNVSFSTPGTSPCIANFVFEIASIRGSGSVGMRGFFQGKMRMCRSARIRRGTIVSLLLMVQPIADSSPCDRLSRIYFRDFFMSHEQKRVHSWLEVYIIECELRLWLARLDWEISSSHFIQHSEMGITSCKCKLNFCNTNWQR